LNEYFSSVFLPQIDLYCRVWKERFLPTLADLNAEAERIGMEAYDLLSARSDPEYADPADIAEQAHNAALDYYLPMADIKQGLINLYPVGLYHLLEQQLLMFFSQELAAPGEVATALGAVQKKLTDRFGISLEKFTSWPQVEELRLLANCVKHADTSRRSKTGRGGARMKEASCESLRRKRPEWFSVIGPPLRGVPVTQPLFGDGIYLEEKTLWYLTDAAKAFWTELGEAICAKGSNNPRHPGKWREKAASKD
jgi:hypothetical protein